MASHAGISRLPDELLSNIFQYLSSKEVTPFLQDRHTHGCARERKWQRVKVLSDLSDGGLRDWQVNRYLSRVRQLNDLITARNGLPIQDLTITIPRHRKLGFGNGDSGMFAVPEAWHLLDLNAMLKSLSKLKSLRLELYVLPAILIGHPDETSTRQDWLPDIKFCITALPAQPIQVPETVQFLYLNDINLRHLWTEPASEDEFKQMMLLERLQHVDNVRHLTLRMACPLRMRLFSSLSAQLKTFSRLESFTFICIEVRLARDSIGTILQALASTCHTFTFIYAPQLEPAFPSNWPSFAPNLRTVRVPMRSVNDPIAGTNPNHNINFEALIDTREFRDCSPAASRSCSLTPLKREIYVGSSAAQTVANRWNATRESGRERRRLVVVDAVMPSRAEEEQQKPEEVPAWVLSECY